MYRQQTDGDTLAFQTIIKTIITKIEGREINYDNDDYYVD